MKHFNKKEPSIPLVMESFYIYTWNELYFTVLHSKKYSILLVSVKLVLYSSLFWTHYRVLELNLGPKSDLFCQSKALCPSESRELIMWTDTTLWTTGDSSTTAAGLQRRQTCNHRAEWEHRGSSERSGPELATLLIYAWARNSIVSV